MRKLALVLLATVAVGCLIGLDSAVPAPAQDPPGSIDGPPADSGALPEELQDAAFERYVDLRQLGEAISSSNASLAADVALQLAEGERILFRSHKAISAKDAMTLAVKLATEKHDKASLQRLGDHAKRTSNDALAQQISQAQSLTGAKRAIDPLFAASVDSLTVEQFSLLRRIAMELEAAKLIGGGKVLKELVEEVKSAGFPEDRKTALLKRLETADAELAKAAASSPETANLTTVLEKLQGVSRVNFVTLYLKLDTQMWYQRNSTNTRAASIVQMCDNVLRHLGMQPSTLTRPSSGRIYSVFGPPSGRGPAVFKKFYYHYSGYPPANPSPSVYRDENAAVAARNRDLTDSWNLSLGFSTSRDGTSWIPSWVGTGPPDSDVTWPYTYTSSYAGRGDPPPDVALTRLECKSTYAYGFHFQIQPIPPGNNSSTIYQGYVTSWAQIMQNVGVTVERGPPGAGDRQYYFWRPDGTKYKDFPADTAGITARNSYKEGLQRCGFEVRIDGGPWEASTWTRQFQNQPIVRRDRPW